MSLSSFVTQDLPKRLLEKNSTASEALATLSSGWITSDDIKRYQENGSALDVAKNIVSRKGIFTLTGGLLNQSDIQRLQESRSVREMLINKNLTPLLAQGAAFALTGGLMHGTVGRIASQALPELTLKGIGENASRSYQYLRNQVQSLKTPFGNGTNTQTVSPSNLAYQLSSARKGVTPDTLPDSTISDKAYQLTQSRTTQTNLSATAKQVSPGQLVTNVATQSAKRYTDTIWLTWMWASIPGIFADFGINFILATGASWISLIKTIFGPLLQKFISPKILAFLPPAFSFLPRINNEQSTNGLKQFLTMSTGMNAFAFFITAHIVWICMTAIIAGALMLAYSITAPYIETASTVCYYFNVHPLCLIAP